MAARILIAAVLSAVLMFFWGFVFWVLLGGTLRLLEPLPGELDILAVLRRENAASGMYLYPYAAEDLGDEATVELEKKMKEGPILRMAFRREGKGMMEPADFVKAFSHYAVLGLLLASLTAMAAAALPTFSRRFGFVILATLLATLWTNVGDVIWWHHPLRWAGGNMLYELGCGVLAAIVIAALVRRRVASV